MAIRQIFAPFQVAALAAFFALHGCSPVPPEERGHVAAIDYDVFIPYDTVRAGILDLPALPDGADDCNGNNIDDAYDWAGYIPRGPYSVGEGPFDIAIGNMNVGGRLELVVLNQLGATVSVLAQNRERRFSSIAEPEVGNSPACLTLADLNGDGIQDILVGHETTEVSAVTALTNAGEGLDFSRADHPLSDDPYLDRNAMCVGAASMIGTGPDILTSSGVSGAGDVNSMMTLFDDGGFTSPEHLRTSTMQDPGKFVIADFDDDGDNDFCTLSTLTQRVTCVKNPSESGGETSLADWPFFFFNAQMRGKALVATRINDDAFPDLVIAGNDGLRIFMNTGVFTGYCEEETDSGHCASMVFNLFEEPLGPFDLDGAAKGLASGDLDGDGDKDLVVSVPDANKVIFVANSRGSLVNARGELHQRDLPVYDTPQGVIAQDIDGDGRIEVVVSNLVSDDIWVLHRRETPVSMMLDCPLPARLVLRSPPGSG